jgi:hypothetical protein
MVTGPASRTNTADEYSVSGNQRILVPYARPSAVSIRLFSDAPHDINFRAAWLIASTEACDALTTFTS